MKQIVVDSAGILVALWVAHLVGDWLLQTDRTARTKAKNPKVRAWHVLLYCIPAGGLIIALAPNAMGGLLVAWVFATHFVIDSYIPLYYFRKAMGDPDAATIEEYAAAFATPRGFFVYVTLDQIFHLVTLAPVAYLLATT